MVEGVVINVDLKITKQRRKQFYIISDYKTPDGSVNRARLHTKYVVAGPVLVPVPVNIPVTAPLLTETKTTIFPANPSTSVPTDHHTPVDPAPVPTTTTTDFYPALLPTTTNVPANCPTIVAPHRNQQLPLPSLPILLLLLYLNLIQPPPHASMPIHLLKMPPVPYPTPPPQNFPVPDTTPPLQHAPVPDMAPPNTSTPMVVADCHGVKWYDYEYVIDLDEVPSLQWKFTNQFGDASYPNSGVWISRLDAWLMMYGKTNLLLSLTTPTWS